MATAASPASRLPASALGDPTASPWHTSTSPSSESSSSTQPSPVQPRSPWGLPPHLQAQAKQLRTRRSPLYVPAVLRPTEVPGTSPPKKKEAGDSAAGDADGQSEPLEGVSSPISASSIRRMVTEEWNDESRTEITGPPSRNHWKPDSSSLKCDLTTCRRHFSIFTRRHHCRRCGQIFCAEHSPHVVPLDQHARFHNGASRFRACVDCFNDYSVWETERVKRPSCSPDDPSITSIKISGKAANQNRGLINTLIAQSVPKDWNWSTF